jgi:hypothetical protein
MVRAGTPVDVEWGYRFHGFRIDEVKLGGDWYLLRTDRTMEPSYDPMAAVAGVLGSSSPSAQIALSEFALSVNDVDGNGLLKDVWLDLIGPRPIPYSEESRRTELPRAYETLAYHLESRQMSRPGGEGHR